METLHPYLQIMIDNKIETLTGEYYGTFKRLTRPNIDHEISDILTRKLMHIANQLDALSVLRADNAMEKNTTTRTSDSIHRGTRVDDIDPDWFAA